MGDASANLAPVRGSLGNKLRFSLQVSCQEKETAMETKTRAELLETYDFVGSFFEGLAQAYNDGKWFHIHLNGIPAYKQRYDWVGPFYRGTAWVRKNGKWIRIRHNGTEMDDVNS